MRNTIRRARVVRRNDLHTGDSPALRHSEAPFPTSHFASKWSIDHTSNPQFFWSRPTCRRAVVSGFVTGRYGRMPWVTTEPAIPPGSASGAVAFIFDIFGLARPAGRIDPLCWSGHLSGRG